MRASNLKNLENPMIHFAVNEQSERFAPHGSIKAVLQTIDKMLVALVEEEKSDIIERDASQTMGKLITDKNEDETSLKASKVTAFTTWRHCHLDAQSLSSQKGMQHHVVMNG